METLYIVLGAFSSIFIFLLGYAAKGVFDLKNRVDYLESFLEDTDNRIDIVINKTREQLVNQMDSMERHLDGNDKEIYAFIDSRLDKLENKFRGDIASGVEVRKVIEKSEKANERLDEFIKTFQSQ
jgi:hemerythrin-like domain-containing protein